MVIDDFLLPVHSRVVLRNIVHRTRTVERHSRDDVLELGRAHVTQHLLHPRTFNLEYADGLAASDHLESFFKHSILLLVAGWTVRDIVHRVANAVMLLDQVTGTAQIRQRRESEKVDF